MRPFSLRGRAGQPVGIIPPDGRGDWKGGDMGIRRTLIGAALAMAAVGFMPAPAGATVVCVADTGNQTVDDKIVGETCWDCGWVMIRGEAYTLFHCD